MHKEVYDWVEQALLNIDIQNKEILELGSFNINGSIRPLFDGNKCYIGVDKHEGRDVNVVSDVSIYDGGGLFDICVSISALEHDSNPINFIKCAYRSIKKGGLFIVTCAGPNTPQHNCDGTPLTTDSYSIIDIIKIEKMLIDCGFEIVVLDEIIQPNDLCAIGRKNYNELS